MELKSAIPPSQEATSIPAWNSVSSPCNSRASVLHLEAAELIFHLNLFQLIIRLFHQHDVNSWFDMRMMLDTPATGNSAQENFSSTFPPMQGWLLLLCHKKTLNFPSQTENCR